MRAMTIMVAVLVGAAPPAIQQVGPGDDGIKRHAGFAFTEGTCELGAEYCARRGPKRWTAEEITIVEDALDAIVAVPAGRAVLERCQQRGGDRLRRYASGLPAAPSGSVPGPAAALHRSPFVTAIDLNDPFFRYAGLRDPFSGSPGFLVTAQVLLHECLHAIDDVSATSEFAGVAGFMQAGSAWRFAAGEMSEIAAIQEYEADLRRLGPSGDVAALWRANRSRAVQMKPVRVPSMQSIRSPAEAFAEIGSHLILDPRARTYLPQEIAAYFDQHVFSRLGPD